jgi:hypothetical protein
VTFYDIERELDIITQSSVFTYLLMLATSSRVETPLVISVNRNVENRWVVVEDLRGPISVVNIPVKDNDFLHCRNLFLNRSGSHTDIIKETESSYLFAVSMMTWGSN